MTITNQNASIFQGDNITLKVTLLTADGDAYAPGVGDVVRYRIARNIHSPAAEAFITKTLGAGLDIVAGVAIIELSPDETASLPLGLYAHEITIADPPTDRSTVMTGTIIVK